MNESGSFQVDEHGVDNGEIWQSQTIPFERMALFGNFTFVLPCKLSFLVSYRGVESADWSVCENEQKKKKIVKMLRSLLSKN